MRLSKIWILYRREVRSALRERTIIVNSILIPIVLYPFILWAMFSGIVFVKGQAERFESRLLVRDLPQAHEAFRDTLREIERIRIVESSTVWDEAVDAIAAGDLDALLEFTPAVGEASVAPDNFCMRLTYDKSREQSDVARGRVVDALNRYRASWLEQKGAALGIEPHQWQVFEIESENTASNRQMGAFLLGMMLPLFFVIMVAVGCYYPAVDSTAGERERSTWETLMTVAASRLEIVVSKYLYVATFGGAAGILNLTAMVFSMKAIMAPLLARSGEEFAFAIPLVGLPVMVLGAVLLAGFVAAGMMLFASFARTFKEGQSMITPFYLLNIMPAVFLGRPDIEFSTGLALIPVANVTMMVREAIMGSLQWSKIALTIGASGCAIALCMVGASFILRFEDVIIGSYSGSLVALLRERLLGRGKKMQRVEEK